MNFKKNRPFAKRFALLFERTQNILREASPQKWMTLPVPYSDNAGFLACGIPAVAITMLPKEEASLYCLELMKDIPDKSIDMILCDLPYGLTRNS